MSEYERLQEVTSRYGKLTGDLIDKARSLTDRLPGEFAGYLGTDQANVRGVPPSLDEPLDFQRVYGEARFSWCGSRRVFLEPVETGICTIIQNKANSGFCFVRSKLTMMLSDGALRLSLSSGECRIKLDDVEDGDLSELCELLLQDVRSAFALEITEATQRSQIGFLKSF